MTEKAKKRASEGLKSRLSIALTAAMLIAFAVAMTLTASAKEGDFKYNFPDGAASVNVNYNGRAVLSGEAAIIDDVTYVPLRSFSELCEADSVEWNSRTQTATVKKYNVSSNISQNLNYIEAGGRYFSPSTPKHEPRTPRARGRLC